MSQFSQRPVSERTSAWFWRKAVELNWKEIAKQ